MDDLAQATSISAPSTLQLPPSTSRQSQPPPLSKSDAASLQALNDLLAQWGSPQQLSTAQGNNSGTRSDIEGLQRDIELLKAASKAQTEAQSVAIIKHITQAVGHMFAAHSANQRQSTSSSDDAGVDADMESDKEESPPRRKSKNPVRRKTSANPPAVSDSDDEDKGDEDVGEEDNTTKAKKKTKSVKKLSKEEKKFFNVSTCMSTILRMNLSINSGFHGFCAEKPRL